MEGLFTTVVSLSATGSIAIAAVLVARLLLKRAPKILSYALWAVILVRLLVPVSFSSPYYGVPTLPDTPAAGFVQQGNALHAVTPAIRPMQVHPNAASSGLSLLTVLSLVWVCGVLGMLLYGMISYGKLRKRLVGAIHLRDNIYMADYLDTPFVIGFVRPRIYLPSTLEDWEMPYILAHEQHHIRRLDYLAKPMGFLALSVHWFNPLVWLSFLLFCKDMEMSCDEAVIGKLGENVRAEYSAALLSLATGHKIIAGMPLAFGEGDTKGRILNMKNWKKPVLWIVVIAALCCVMLGVFLLTTREKAPKISVDTEVSYCPLLDASTEDLNTAQAIVDDWSVRAEAAFAVTFGIEGDYQTKITIGESTYFKTTDPRFSSVEDLNRILYAACTDSGLRTLGMGPAEELYREQDGALYRLEADYVTCQDWDAVVLGIVEQSDGKMVLRMPIASDTMEDTTRSGTSAYDVTFVKDQDLWKLDRQAAYMGELPESSPTHPTALALTEETANACMTEILHSFRVEDDGTVTFSIPNEIPQSENAAVCLNIDLSAEFGQGDQDASQTLLEQERHWQGGEVYTGQLNLSLGKPKRIFLRVSFPEAMEDGWKDVFPAQYLELTPPSENEAAETEKEASLSAEQSGSKVLVDLTFLDAPAVQLSFTLPKGVVLGEAVSAPDSAGYLLQDVSGKEIGEFFFMGLAAGPEDLQSVETSANRLPMQIFAGAALPNHVMYEDYQVQASTATGAAATALFSSQDLSLMDAYGSAAAIPFDDPKNLALFYDYEKMPVFLQIGFDAESVSQQECAEIAKSIRFV